MSHSFNANLLGRSFAPGLTNDARTRHKDQGWSFFSGLAICDRTAPTPTSKAFLQLIVPLCQGDVK